MLGVNGLRCRNPRAKGDFRPCRHQRQFELALVAAGAKITFGTGVAAAQAVYAKQAQSSVAMAAE